MLPDLESLRCFDAAATHLNFRVAAKAVALSPAAFGDRIKRLEDQLGAVLFARTTRKVALSPAGQRLVPQARRVLGEAERCRGVVLSDGRAPYELTIGTRFELGLSWLTPGLTELQRSRPERTIHLVFGDSPELVARIRNGLLDGAVTSARIISGGMAYEPLHDEDYVFVAGTSLARRQPLRGAAEAREHVLIDAAGELPLFRYFLDACRDRDAWTFTKVELLGTIGAIRLRVLQGAGVAVLPRYFVARDIKAGRLVQLCRSVRLHRDAFRLIWREGHARDAELRQLATELARIPLR